MFIQNDVFLISTALNFNISDRRMDYKTFCILHIIEHCLVSSFIRGINDYKVYSRVSGKTNNYNLNIEINTLTTLNELTSLINMWKDIALNSCFDPALFDKQKKNVIQEIKNNFSSYRNQLITINNIISIENICYPSLTQIEIISYEETMKSYGELLLTERYISTCYEQKSFITPIDASKLKYPISPALINYKSVYRVTTNDNSEGNWLIFLFGKTKTIDEYIFKEIALNCFYYILRCYLKENEAEFIIASKNNDNIASYLLIKINNQHFYKEKLIDFISVEKLNSILTDDLYANIIDDFSISSMFQMESCRSRNEMLQKLYNCFGKLPKESIRADIEKYLYNKDKSGIISKIIESVNTSIEIIFLANNL